MQPALSRHHYQRPESTFIIGHVSAWFITFFGYNFKKPLHNEIDKIAPSQPKTQAERKVFRAFGRNHSTPQAA
jgi:hypothetical protein